MTAGKHIVFVCTGNICRSPMAEYLLRDRIGPDGRWVVESAGTAAADGMSASSEGVAALREIGIDSSGHRSQCVTAELIAAATLVVVMTRSHGQQLMRRFPESREKIVVLKALTGEEDDLDVLDPIGLPVAAYRETRDEIAEAIPAVVEYIERHS